MLGFAVLGLAACSDEGGPPPRTAPTPTPAPPPSPTDSPPVEPRGGLDWSRVDLGFVSAYVLVRGNEAAVVDTGVVGSADAIGAVLDEAGPGWAGMRHVVLTHKHDDHAGSITAVLAQAEGATGHVGVADLGAVTATQPLRPIEDGDEVFGLQIIGTPGHTAGHVAVFDPDTAVLVAGDALTNEGTLSGSNPQFTEDEAAAAQSIRKLADLAPRTILVGHGSPLVEGAAAALDALAASIA